MRLVPLACTTLLVALSLPSIAAEQGTASSKPAPLADAKTDAGLKKFLASIEGTYGWQPLEGDVMLDFFSGGNLQAQGPDGEATMWEGKWSLKGDQLTVSYNKKKFTYTAKREGDFLILSGKKYRRYKPE